MEFNIIEIYGKNWLELKQNIDSNDNFYYKYIQYCKLILGNTVQHSLQVINKTTLGVFT